MLIGTPPGVAALCAAYEIGRRLIGRSGLHCPPVALGSAAFVAGDFCSRQSHIVVVGYDDLHLGVCFPFHVILLLNILAGQ